MNFHFQSIVTIIFLHLFFANFGEAFCYGVCSTHFSTTLMASEEQPWSCMVTSNRDGTLKCKEILCGELAVETNRTYTMQSPREWMESIESREGAHGAYTVLRYDIKSSRAPAENSTQNVIGKTWGEEFHLKRLPLSFKAMTKDKVDKKAEIQALQASKIMLKFLLNYACKNLEQMKCDGKNIKILMVTLLWQPRPHEDSILVRAHAFSTNKQSIPRNYNPNPITAAIALNEEELSHVDLPSRHDKLPHAKLSSWCRNRRPLEKEFKIENVGEVLLVKQSYTPKSDWELLEGLTSNLFVIYKDGSIRTASDSVLKGYARHLVFEAVERNGLKISNKPILLSDAKAGLWSEAFLTSSIRLVIPLAKVLIGHEREHWFEVPCEELPWETRRWKLLYDDIILKELEE